MALIDTGDNYHYNYQVEVPFNFGNLWGCANHHAMVAFRGKPSVYDESWRYKNLVPYFEKVEKIYPGNCATTQGGRDGWLSLTHTEPELMDLELLSAMINDFHFTYRKNTTEDENGVGFWNFMINPDGKRSSSALSLLSSILQDPQRSLSKLLFWRAARF